MFGIGANELVLILIFGFLIFGPDKLPAMAKTIGQAIAKFRTAQNEMNKVIKEEVWDPTSEDPFKNPLDAMSKLDKTVNGEGKQETFAQRKARYEKQQAAKKRAEERRAEKAAQRARAKQQDQAEEAEAISDVAPMPESKPEPTPEITADMLYGIKPAVKKPKADKNEALESKQGEGE